MGTYRCICDNGYEVDATGKICSDINECELEDSLCSGGQCRNTPGSFQASEFYLSSILITWESSIFLDTLIYGFQINFELMYRNRDWSSHSQCICPTGMRYNTQNQMCEDVDECEELGPDVCFNGVCINTLGAYECECSPGYVLDNTGYICRGTRQQLISSKFF